MNPDHDFNYPQQRVLVIDDEAVIGLSCERILGKAGHQISACQSSVEGLELALHHDYDVILLDLVMPEMDGLETLKRLKEAGVRAEVIIITGYPTVKTAVQAMKTGAAEYVNKPFTPDELMVVFDKVMRRSALIRENEALRRELRQAGGFEGIIGESRAMERVFALIKRIAPTNGTVLIIGESGTGKEMVARAVHRNSMRSDKPLLACDCSTLTPSLLESELFGHVKGSFTGAVSTKLGLFEAADKGTLFLDETGNIPKETQGKLLRVLESHSVKRVGDVVERPIDIRLITATNSNLAEMVRKNEFREDLYYRLNVVPIHLPPLRERHGDIPLLAMCLLEAFRRKNPVRAAGFTPEAMALMESYHWPGNVRELKNMVQRMAILCDGERIEVQHLPEEIRQAPLHTPKSNLPHTWEEMKQLKQKVRETAVERLERQFLLESLRRNDSNISRAAEDVGMQRTHFHALIKKYDLK